MTHSETIIAREGEFSIVRVRYWGFRCNSLSTYWEIRKAGNSVAHWSRMRDAKKEFKQLTSSLRERLCTPMTVGEASLAASSVI